MKKSFLLLLIAVLMVGFITSCGIITPTAIAANWKGTVTITDHSSSLWFVGDLPGNSGIYTAEVKFTFDWFLNPNKINGGTITLTQKTGASSQRIEIEPDAITSGEYNATAKTLYFNAYINTNSGKKNIRFEGTVTNGELTASAVKENNTTVGTINISAQ